MQGWVSEHEELCVGAAVVGRLTSVASGIVDGSRGREA